MGWCSTPQAGAVPRSTKKAGASSRCAPPARPWRCDSATAPSIRPHSPRRLVWRTHDPDTDKAARPYLDAAPPLRKQPVNVRVDGARRRAARRPSGASARAAGSRSSPPSRWRAPADRGARPGVSARAIRPPRQHGLRVGRTGIGNAGRAVRTQLRS